MITRRQFLKMGAALGVGFFVPRNLFTDIPTVHAFYQTNGLKKFAQPLRGVGPAGIPVAMPDGTRSYAKGKVVAQHYTLDINQYQDQLHPDLGPTTLWGYNPRNALGVSGIPTQRHLGGIIIAHKGVPVQLTVQNNLPPMHILPVDTTIMGAQDAPNRVTVHLHGGEVPWISDGGPFTWFDPNGHYGSSVTDGKNLNIYKILNPGLKNGQAEYFYPNSQSARMEWYHDHAVGITRLNAYAGIASAYIIRDDFEASLVKQGLPDFIENGGREIPLVFQEKIFVGEDIASADPDWVNLNLPKTPGSLWYPHVYESRWDSIPGSTQPPISVIPEFFGDTMLVNGVVHPFAGLEPRLYRLRILNATQARFLNLQLYEADSNNQPILSSRGPDFMVIGTEGGFLAFPSMVPSNRPMNFLPDGISVDLANPGGSLLVGPGERFDVLIDFKGFKGRKFILYNDAPAPFPGGDPANDYQDPTPTGHNTRTIMRFDIAKKITGTPDLPLKITPQTPLALNPHSGVKRPLVPNLDSFAKGGKINPDSGIHVRQLTLNEIFDASGRLIQMLGTNEPTPLPEGFTMDPTATDYPNNYARAYDDPTSEVVHAGAIEIWQIANLTMDTHPMHFHLANVQVLARQSITAADGSYQYANGVPTYTGPLKLPNALEWGWKETVKMSPGEVTTVIMKFDLPSVPFSVPPSPRTGGYEYVWHCHILEHEEHDMMRPLVVI
jgi:spore coat protein A, manganese oxidase